VGVFTLGLQGSAFVRSIERTENRISFLSSFGLDDDATFMIPEGLTFDRYNDYHVLSKTNLGELRLAEFDSLGNLQEFKELSIGSTSRSAKEIVGNDKDNLFMVGSADLSTFAQKINSSGEIDWSASLTDEIDTGLVQKFHSVVLNSSQQLFALGTAEDVNRSHTTGSKYCEDLIVVKYDVDGSVLWQKRISAGLDEDGTSNLSFMPFGIGLDNNGQIAILAIRADWDGTDYTTGKGITLIKLDSVGTNVWQQEFEQPIARIFESAAGLSVETIYSNVSLSLDGFNNIYAFYTTQSGNANDGFDTFSVLVKYSGNGTLIYQREINATNKEIVSKDVKVSLGGEVYALLANLTDKKSSLIKILSNGTVSWERDFYLDDADFYTILTKIELDKFNNIIAAGTIINTTNERQGVLAKLPNDGTGIGTDTFKSKSIVYSVASLGVSTPTYANFSPNYIVSDSSLAEEAITATTPTAPSDTDKTIIFEAGV